MRKLIECLERYTFRDGVRLAWVTWEIGGERERVCVAVREFASAAEAARASDVADATANASEVSQ